MSLLVNIRHLETRELRLQGDMPLVDLDLESLDELMQPAGNLHYDLVVQRMEDGLLVQGHLELPLACECARCLRPFRTLVRLPEYCALLPWEGEEAIALQHDCVDLTPHLREDIVLALPQRPLCEPECRGLVNRDPPSSGPEAADGIAGPEPPSSAWAELNKLKL
jgi:uncharacterized metal-binding protein YceD (DUF177 family)